MTRSGHRRRLAKAFVSEAFRYVIQPAGAEGLCPDDRDIYLSASLTMLRREIEVARRGAEETRNHCTA